MIKTAMLSFWHVHASDYARQAEEHPDTEIVAVWDEIPERGQKEAEKRGVRFFASLDELLAQEDIDAVIVDAPTSMHHEVMMKAARARKHMFTEKVLAATLKEANDIVKAVNEAGVRLVVSLPRLSDGYTLAIRKILDKNLLGEVTLVRARLSHNGATAGWLPNHFFSLEQCGGGAMIDLGCHPMYLARLFLGQMPESVSANYGYITGKEVEDNAIAVLQCAGGAIGIVEAGFVNSHSPFTLEVHGTEGSLLYGTPEDKLLLRTNAKGETRAGEWQEVPLPERKPGPFRQWVEHIKNGTVAEENIRLALDLTWLMEAANLSAQEKRTILLSEIEA